MHSIARGLYIDLRQVTPEFISASIRDLGQYEEEEDNDDMADEVYASLHHNDDDDALNEI
mgnify:CR=1 FL=1